MRRGPMLAAVLVLLSACQRSPRTGLDFAGQYPERLSEWRILESRGNRLVLNTGVVPYALSSALFSDYAHKLRTVLVPRGTAIRYADESFEFPVGTVITKTFYYPRPAGESGIAVAKVVQESQGESLDLVNVRLIETRVLVNTASGWIALPYVWSADQSEATLSLAGDSLSLELVHDQGRTPFTYMVPDANQCAACHVLEHHQQKLKPIGVRARHLNRNYAYARSSENQLVHWQKLGLLTGAPAVEAAPRNVQWDNPANANLASRARAYLDINCGHCHRPRGAAATSGLLLHAQETNPVKLGVCKIPVATGRGSGGALFDIVPGRPGESILLHRMESTEADVAMPELGRALVHTEGVSLIRDWIETLRGRCAT